MFSIDNSLLVVIDVQGRLAAKMHEKNSLYTNLELLIKLAKILEIPCVYTEQVPDKIGSTVEEVVQFLDGVECIKKDTFSCWGEPHFAHTLESFQREQIIIAGIEAHVCVCQTVLDLLDNHYQVEVVADAVSARSEHQKHYAIERMRSRGADIVTVEMLVTELLQTGSHPRFKDVLELIK